MTMFVLRGKGTVSSAQCRFVGADSTPKIMYTAGLTARMHVEMSLEMRPVAEICITLSDT